VLHFAANMGGMGAIHELNDSEIYAENHQMTQCLISASLATGVALFMYASSACVYPASLQGDHTTDASLRESDVWVNGRPSPQGLYGLEKLHSENLLLAEAHKFKKGVRIARFHNMYASLLFLIWCLTC
jgi:nucleoside-diphosphate-sugar epimerase